MARSDGQSGLRPGDAPDPRRRRRALLAAGLGVVVIAGAAGVAHGITVGRWIAPVETIASAADTDDSVSAAGRGAEPRMPVPTTMPTPTETPTPEPTPEPGSGLLGVTVPQGLDGTLIAAAGSREPTRSGTVRTVRVEVEKGLPVDLDVFADAVMTMLDDDRGWSTLDDVALSRVDGDADYVVTLASPDTTDELCAPLQTNGWLSCGNGNRAALNFDRWVDGSDDFKGDVATYRQYLVNHEVGHLLGHHHEQCTGNGDVADVMVQQTISAQGCSVNGWPTATRG